MTSADKRDGYNLTTVTLVAALALTVAACGGGLDDQGSDQTTASQQTATSISASSMDTKRKAAPYMRKGVTAMAVAPDGGAIGVADSDGQLRIFDGTGVQVSRVLRPRGSDVAAGVVFAAGGRYMVSVGRDSTAQLWNVATGERVAILQGSEHALRAVASSGDGSIVVTGGEEARVMLWDGNTGRLKAILRGLTDFVNCLAVSPDGSVVASGDAAARVLLWNAQTGQLLHTLRGHAGEVNAVAFSSNGKLLVSSGEDGKVILWDTAGGQQAGALEGHRARVRSLAFTADGMQLAAGTQDGRVVLWDMASLSVVQDITASPYAVNAVAFGSLAGNQLFAGGEDSNVFSMKLPRKAAR
jgi:WD40 repeat protein